MPAAPNFRQAKLVAMSLAKVGNPVRGEGFQVSKTLCRFQNEEAELLTHCFLKPFRSLEPFRLAHHTAVENNELHGYATAIFDDPATLLAGGEKIARHLRAKSNHPNIKSGDLCVALIEGVRISGEATRALAIVKSESKVPFLQISERDGDLVLTTEHGIYPDKIDKGCLIVDHGRADGYSVYLFDKSGAGTHFWIRDFVGAEPVTDDDYLTRRYAELCVAFAQRGLPEETRQEERMEVASRSMRYLEESDEFDLEEFEEKALGTPERIERFEEFKSGYESERGAPLQENFSVSKTVAEKACAKLNSRMKLDTGVTLQFSSGFVREADRFLERGHDEERGMDFVKIYFHREE